MVPKPIDSNTKGEFIRGYYFRSTALLGLNNDTRFMTRLKW